MTWTWRALKACRVWSIDEGSPGDSLVDVVPQLADEAWQGRSCLLPWRLGVSER